MVVAKVAALQRTWLRDKDLQAALDAAFDRIGFTDAYVAVCIESVRAGTASRKTKYIKDNIWGMVRANAHTMRLLDALR
jgi:hypothetical protein